MRVPTRPHARYRREREGKGRSFSPIIRALSSRNYAAPSWCRILGRLGPIENGHPPKRKSIPNVRTLALFVCTGLYPLLFPLTLSLSSSGIILWYSLFSLFVSRLHWSSLTDSVSLYVDTLCTYLYSLVLSFYLSSSHNHLYFLPNFLPLSLF